MSKCRGKCTAGVPSRSMLPRQRPRTAGSGIPQYSQTRIARPALMPPPQASRPRSALPVARRPPQGAPRGLPVQRRPASNIPVPFSRGAGASSRIPCPRRIGIAQPSVTINAARSRGNDININIRLSIEPPDEELEEFERLEREMEELEEFERMERQCELECSNSGSIYFSFISHLFTHLVKFIVTFILDLTPYRYLILYLKYILKVCNDIKIFWSMDWLLK